MEHAVLFLERAVRAVAPSAGPLAELVAQLRAAPTFGAFAALRYGAAPASEQCETDAYFLLALVRSLADSVVDGLARELQADGKGVADDAAVEAWLERFIAGHIPCGVLATTPGMHAAGTTRAERAAAAAAALEGGGMEIRGRAGLFEK